MSTVPPSPRHPGRILEEDYLSRLPEDTTQGELAERLSMSRPRLNDLIHGRRSVSLDTALRLARCFGTSPEFWLQAQLRWDLHQARRARARMREIGRIEPWPLRPGGPEAGATPPETPAAAAAETPLLRAPRPAEGETAGSTPYYEEFLRRRGLLEEARRFVRIQGQLDVLEPHRPEARRRLQRPIRLPDGALALPPLPLWDAARERPTEPAGGGVS